MRRSKQKDYSITSSARASSLGGIARPLDLNGRGCTRDTTHSCGGRTCVPPHPCGVPEIAFLQPALRLVRCACRQASILLPPGLTPAQFRLRSTAHSLATTLACSIAAWHG